MAVPTTGITVVVLILKIIVNGYSSIRNPIIGSIFIAVHLEIVTHITAGENKSHGSAAILRAPGVTIVIRLSGIYFYLPIYL